MLQFLLLIGRGIRRGFLTLLRERGWGATLLALTGILLLAQLLIVILLGAQGIDGLIREQTDLTLQIVDSATDSQIRDFYSALQQLPSVQSTDYVTREKAYELERQRDPDLVAFLDKFKMQNPFPETIGVTLTSLADYDAFATFVKNPQWKNVVDPNFLSKATDQEQRIHELLRVTSTGRMLVLIFLCLIAFVLLFILMELVRRRALMRSEEIFIERLFGARDFSVVIPFVTEAAFLLMSALLLSIGCLYAFLHFLPRFVPALASQGIFASLHEQVVPLLMTLLPVILLAELIIAPVISLLGAWFGMWPQLHSRRLVAER